MARPNPAPPSVNATGVTMTTTSAPAAVDLAAGASATFTYRYTLGTGTGSFSLSAGATGLDTGVLPAARWTSQDFAAAVVPWFGQLVARCARPFVIVLDDVHVIDAPEAIDLLDALAANVPPDSTVVLVGRAIPGTPLGRLRVRPAYYARKLALFGSRREYKQAMICHCRQRYSKNHCRSCARRRR